MTSLIGTVHKPQQPPIPEPEGWIILEYCSGGWWVDSGYLVKPSERESLEDAVSTIKNTPIRLVQIGPAPKVPVDEIARLRERIVKLEECVKAADALRRSVGYLRRDWTETIRYDAARAALGEVEREG